MKLIPYVLIDGGYSLTDSVMLGIYDEMRDNRLDRAVFYTGGMTPSTFLRFMKNERNVVHTIWSEEEFPVKPDILMIAWLNQFGKNHAMAHFCCFPKAWGARSKELANMTLEYWFDFENNGTPLLDVLIGFTPANNRLAVRWIKQVGMTALGQVPYMNTGEENAGMVVSYITREEFKNGRR